MNDMKVIASPLGAMAYLEAQDYAPGSTGFLVLDHQWRILLMKLFPGSGIPDRREFFREALAAGPSASGAIAFVVAAEVSQQVEEAREFAIRLHDAGAVLGLPLLDFLVIAAPPSTGASTSFRAREPWT